MGKFISQKGMSDLRKQEAILNSKIKRGEIDADYVSLCVCGCSDPDCAFAVARKFKNEKETDFNKEFKAYIEKIYGR